MSKKQISKINDLWSEDHEDLIFSPSLGEFDLLDLVPPPPPAKGRLAQDEALRRAGINPNEVRRPPLHGHEDQGQNDVNDAGVLLPAEEGDLFNER